MRSDVCDDCFVKWDISDIRDDAFMQYRLKKVNMHLPFWLDWNPFKNDNAKYKNWVKSAPEYVKKQNEDNPFEKDEGNKKSTHLSSGCIAQYKDKIKAFGVGMDTEEDARVSLQAIYNQL